jgi:DNA-binding PadR family transcriptional regulator
MSGENIKSPQASQRLFEKGTLKYIVLDFLKVQPSHGYEIIQVMKNRLAGFYTISPGSVYPALQFLYKAGYVKSTEQDGKYIYTITEEGRKFLHEKEAITDKIKDHLRNRLNFNGREEVSALIDVLHQFVSSLRHDAPSLSPEKLSRMKNIVDKALNQIREVVNE